MEITHVDSCVLPIHRPGNIRDRDGLQARGRLPGRGRLLDHQGSRLRVVGYAISHSIDARLTAAALKAAIRARKPPKGCVHHSDRGSQYASEIYRQLLADHELVGSMGRRGNPYDNAKAESFMKTLKSEEVYRNEYRDFNEAHTSIGEFLERVYNQKRLHSALGYLPPAEFENGAAQ